MISLLVLLTTTITTLVLADGNITVADVTTALGLGDAQVSNVSVAGVSTPAAVPSVDVASNPGMSQQRLNISCAQAVPCQPGFVCVPQLPNGTFLAPVIPNADYIQALQASEQAVMLEGQLCQGRQLALADAVSKLTVGVSVALRLTMLMINEAVQSQVATTIVLARLQAAAVGGGLAQANAQLPCNETFTAAQCDTIGDFVALAALRAMDDAAGRPERLLPINASVLADFLADEVSAEDEAVITALGAGASPGNPFTDPFALQLFKDVKTVSDAVAVSEVAAVLANASNAADPALQAIEIMRRNFVHLEEYVVSLQLFAVNATVFFNTSLGDQIAFVRASTACSGDIDSSAACVAGRLANLRNLTQVIADSMLNAAAVVEFAKIRAAFVWMFLNSTQVHVEQLFLGVVQCVQAFETHVQSIQTVQVAIEAFVQAHSSELMAAVATLQSDVASVQALLAQVPAGGSVATSLTPTQQAALAAAVGKLQSDKAAATAGVQQLVGASIATAEFVECRRQLASEVTFALRAVCAASDSDAACETRVENYFNGVKANIEANNATLAAAYAQLSQIAGCWPLVRFEIAERVVAGAFVAALNGTSANADQTLVLMQLTSADPCSAVPANETCQEVRGKLVIPADCTPATAASTAGASDSSLIPANGGNMTKRAVRRAEASDSATASAFLGVLGTDNGQTFGTQSAAGVNTAGPSSYAVATSPALVTPPTCAQLGLPATTPGCAGMMSSGAGGSTAAATLSTGGTTTTTGSGTTATSTAAGSGSTQTGKGPAAGASSAALGVAAAIVAALLALL